MFTCFESISDEELASKIQQVERLQRSFDPKSEASMDAKFMLRHMRRIHAQRLFKPAHH